MYSEYSVVRYFSGSGRDFVDCCYNSLYLVRIVCTPPAPPYIDCLVRPSSREFYDVLLTWSGCTVELLDLSPQHQPVPRVAAAPVDTSIHSAKKIGNSKKINHLSSLS
jgi:hypothetical protein